MATLTDIQSQAQKVQSAQQTATNMAQSGITLEDDLRSAISERFNQNPILPERANQMEKALTSGANARADISNMVNNQGIILSPTQQQQILAGREANAFAPLATLNDMLRVERGSIDNMIGAGSRAYQSQVAGAQAAAAGEQSVLENLMKMFQLSESQRQFDVSQANSGAGSSNFLEMLMGGGQQPTEPQPQYSPKRIGEMSAGGQWKFTTEGWTPAQSGNVMGSLTPEALAAGVLSGDINASAAKILGNLSGAIPTSNQLKQQSTAQGAQFALDKASEYLQGIPAASLNPLSALSKIGAYIPGGTTIPGVNDSAKLYNDFVNSFTGPIARSVLNEVGVLTDQDISRAQQVFPSIWDPANIRQEKLNVLRQAINNIKMGNVSPQTQNILETQIQGQDDGFIPD